MSEATFQAAKNAVEKLEAELAGNSEQVVTALQQLDPDHPGSTDLAQRYYAASKGSPPYAVPTYETPERETPPVGR